MVGIEVTLDRAEVGARNLKQQVRAPRLSVKVPPLFGATQYSALRVQGEKLWPEPL